MNDTVRRMRTAEGNHSSAAEEASVMLNPNPRCPPRGWTSAHAGPLLARWHSGARACPGAPGGSCEGREGGRGGGALDCEGKRTDINTHPEKLAHQQRLEDRVLIVGPRTGMCQFRSHGSERKRRDGDLPHHTAKPDRQQGQPPGTKREGRLTCPSEPREGGGGSQWVLAEGGLRWAVLQRKENALNQAALQDQAQKWTTWIHLARQDSGQNQSCQKSITHTQ